jgi:hypothetical protein
VATTPAKAFDEFDQKIQPTEIQKETTKARRDAVSAILRELFDSKSSMVLRKTRLIGSAGRGTIIRPIDDIDLLAIFDNTDGIFEQYRHDSKKFLYRIRDGLARNYSVKVIGARGQAVRLFYTQAPHVDIAPVFSWQGGGYALPKGDGTWLTTDPDKQDAWLAERNEALGYHLRPLQRFVKRWNREHSRRLKTFHLEVVTAASFGSLGSNYRVDSLRFFEWAGKHLSVQDPAGHSGDLSSYLTSTARSEVRTSLISAHERASRAVEAESNGNYPEALRLWRIVFGDEFPAYG